MALFYWLSAKTSTSCFITLFIQRTFLSLLQHMLALRGHAQRFHPLVLLVLLVLVDQFKPSRDCWSQHHVVQTRTHEAQVS